MPCFTAMRAEIALMSGSAFAVTHHAFSSGAGRTSDGNGSHASTLKSPSYTKSVSWQHYQVIGGNSLCKFFITRDRVRIQSMIKTDFHGCRFPSCKKHADFTKECLTEQPCPESPPKSDGTIRKMLCSYGIKKVGWYAGRAIRWKWRSSCRPVMMPE
ncbi:putative integrase encoded by prophage CP-933K (plasmid) [Shigella boydii CDC 3083-94]|uniref:Integrase encoded by prophage CP-933K n=1 Tax=Shigella boydii serotype 18 (strain CDC 3083-94 / BS512) TaxID=344609 RepID=B2TT59_SHIB3|nr:putative integrase encoded by prophage CP-933K [Shigella boydii CDC 3083-94]